MDESLFEPVDFLFDPLEEEQLVAERLAPHAGKAFPNAVNPGLSAYRGNVLLVRTAALEAGHDLVDRLNDILGRAGLGRPVSGPAAPAGPVTPLAVDGVDAYEVWEALREHEPSVSLDRLLDAGAIVRLPPEQLLFAAGRKQGHGDTGRAPVAVLAAAPSRRRLTELPGCRRPVVALLDTGVGGHPWLPGEPDDDPFWVDAATRGWTPPATAGPEVVNRYSGHGTFIAGLVRQEAPDARVLSVRLMHDDGVVYASDFLRALRWLRAEVECGDRDRFVDVLCVAFGYQERPEDTAHTGELRELLGALARAGVTIVASAGNNRSERRTYPAALAVDPALPAGAVISVGALNPNGTVAYYSNYGTWVTERAIGTGLVSTMPRLDGSGIAEPSEIIGNEVHQGLDPDDFRGGFGRWSGTSFAAALVAAGRARTILTNALAENAPAGDVRAGDACAEDLRAETSMPDAGARP
jgi:hypothetical protein